MARSFSNAKLLSAFIVDRFSVAASRRGYAAVSQGVVSGSVRGGGGSSGVIVKKGGEDSTGTCSWSPDPITGYYRPENHANDIDVAQLRETLLNHKISRH